MKVNAAITLLSTITVATFAGGTGSLDVARDGAFGFPQAKAKVLCDRKDLRVSAWNNTTHLYIQAVLWDDNEGEAKTTEAGRQVKDTSSLVLDLDNNKKPTAKVDREYSLTADLTTPGLFYNITLGPNKTTPLIDDSKGRGAIRHVDIGKGKKVRVDCYVLPLGELGQNPGGTIRLAFWARSIKPAFTVNSVGFKSSVPYYADRLPAASFHELALADDVDEPLDVNQVPDEPRKK